MAGVEAAAAEAAVRAVFVAATLSLAAFGTARSAVLARVDFGPGQSVEALAALDVPVVFQLDGACLVYTDERDLSRIAYAGYLCRVLVRQAGAQSYVYASFEPGDDRTRVRACAEVLTEDSGGLVLAVDESAVRFLPGLGCELARITMRPLVSGSATSAPAPVPLPESFVWELVNRVSVDTLEAWLRRLIAFRTRDSEHDSCRAAVAWLGDRLSAYGCDTVIYDDYQAEYSPQVIGVKFGTVNPRRIFVVCGHVDDASEQPTVYAPGSEDNASGTGCMLECARVLADMDFDYTVWFIAWTGEEQGLVGSADFLARARARGDSIILGMNFDMISYGPQDRDSIRVVGKRANPPCSTWVEFFRAQADTFTSLKHLRYMVNDQQTSDHYSFWANGFTCIRGGYNVRTDVYHTTGDTVGPLYYVRCGTNNIPMYTEVVKATVATLAKLAGAHSAVGIAGSDDGWQPEMSGVTLARVAPGATLFDAAGKKTTGTKPGVYFAPVASHAGIGPRYQKVVVTR